jgi:uncharacterized protein YegL
MRQVERIKLIWTNSERRIPMPARPGGALATRPLHFIWLADCSGSMSQDGKIQALNNAIREALPHMQKVAGDNPHADVLVRAIRFSQGAEWHVAAPTPIAQFRWTDLHAGGVTDLGAALRLLAQELKVPPMSERALPPVLVLVSDGQPTDDFEGGLRALLSLPWGLKAVRLAIAIGSDADPDTLEQFINNPAVALLHANNPESLVNNIKWVSTAVLLSVSAPASQTQTVGAANANVPVPQPPPPMSSGDVW